MPTPSQSSFVAKLNDSRATTSVTSNENDFPMHRVSTMRLGSAHVVIEETEQIERCRSLMSRLVSSINIATGVTNVIDVYEGNRCGDETLISSDRGVTDPHAPLIAPDLGPFSLMEQSFETNLYVCLRFEGYDARNQPLYCYCSMFLKSLRSLCRTLARTTSFNPKEHGAIVLSRAQGYAPTYIRDFMRMKFSFADEDQPVALEISLRGKRHS